MSALLPMAAEFYRQQFIRAALPAVIIAAFMAAGIYIRLWRPKR
jgi:hypothetical protein